MNKKNLSSLLIDNTYVLVDRIFVSACNCSIDGSRNQKCNPETGKCTCKPYTTGDKCNACKKQYVNFPNCQVRFYYLNHESVQNGHWYPC